ncbi:MAG: hypothetical protein RSE07_03560, partial [Oscillospiraceae bacterium]
MKKSIRYSSLIAVLLLLIICSIACTNEPINKSVSSQESSELETTAIETLADLPTADSFDENIDSLYQEYLKMDYYVLSDEQYESLKKEFQKLINYKNSENCDEKIYKKLDVEFGIKVNTEKRGFKDKKESTIYVVFDIMPDKTIKVSSESPKTAEEIGEYRLGIYQKIYDGAFEFIPEGVAKFFTQFALETDGYSKFGARVDPLNDEMSKWKLNFDVLDNTTADGGFQRGFLELATHELGHVITMNSEQYTTEKTDNTYNDIYGYSRPDSIMNKFYNKFWGDEKYKEHQAFIKEWEANATEEEKNAPIKDNLFYQKYRTEFITQYAATEPLEDFAETFKYFVFDPKPSDG